MIYTYEELQAPVNPYKEHGFNTRSAYLSSIAEEYDLPLSTVLSFAQMLGSNEDFDGLINEIEYFQGCEDCE